VPITDKLNPISGLIVGATVGGVVGLWLNNFALWLVLGTSLGLLVGQYCRNRAKDRQREADMPHPT